MTIIIADCKSQSLSESYNSFKLNSFNAFNTHRAECNRRYADFLREAWDWYEGKAPLPVPNETPVPPRPYSRENEAEPVCVEPVDVRPIETEPQPKPLESIPEVAVPDEEYFTTDFYGSECKVRLPENARLRLSSCRPQDLAEAWQQLSDESMNNAIRDCLETRVRYSLCDWAYLMFLDKICREYCRDGNGATLLTAFLYCQSGYQMRLAVDGNRLLMLYGSRHRIYDKRYFDIDGTYFYPWGEPSKSISICNAAFDGETPMSLYIGKEQLFDQAMSPERKIASERYSDMSVNSQVPQRLIEFYNRYPSAETGNNPMTRWAMYANTPLAQKTKDLIYPDLKECIKNLPQKDAADRLLNWVQTGFEYEYDDKVWGHDRAFFAEESLYYPYCDCEDRSILFSRLVRDLLDLDVALIYYPGHLATAVCFTDDVGGDTMMISGRKFTVCDPTYIGAPVGAQMPGLKYDKAMAIVLDR